MERFSWRKWEQHNVMQPIWGGRGFHENVATCADWMIPHEVEDSSLLFFPWGDERLIATWQRYPTEVKNFEELPKSVQRESFPVVINIYKSLKQQTTQRIVNLPSVLSALALIIWNGEMAEKCLKIEGWGTSKVWNFPEISSPFHHLEALALFALHR